MASTVTDALDAIAQAGATITLDGANRLVVDASVPLDENTVTLIRRHRRALAWSVLGRGTGHEYLACDLCGEAQLVDTARSGRLCHMTPRCAGKIRHPQRASSPKGPSREKPMGDWPPSPDPAEADGEA